MIEFQGTDVPCFVGMKQEELIKNISHLIESHGFFVVEIQINSQGKIQIYMDSTNGKVTINDCVAVSRSILNSNEEIAERYGIEVSSPGLNYPFKVMEQYRKNIGNTVSVLLKDGKKLNGKLSEVQEEKIILTDIRIKKEKKKKMEEVVNHEIFFEQIKSTKQII